MYDIVLAIVQKCKDALYLYEGVRRTNWKLNIYAKIHVYTEQCTGHLYKNYNSEVRFLSTEIVHCLCRANTETYRQIYVHEDTHTVIW